MIHNYVCMKILVFILPLCFIYFLQNFITFTKRAGLLVFFFRGNTRGIISEENYPFIGEPYQFSRTIHFLVSFNFLAVLCDMYIVCMFAC